MVSFANRQQTSLVAEICSSFVFDNGAFSFWKAKHPVDWEGFYRWVDDWRRHPGFEWALIPDMIEGNEKENDDLLYQWPFKDSVGVPVWHLHESLERLRKLADNWPRIALGSSAEFAKIGTEKWWTRMSTVMRTICDSEGSPITKIHGLRMMDPKVFGQFPFSSVDSTNVARNIGIDSRWKGTYLPPSKAARGLVLAQRIEAFQSAERWIREGEGA